MKEAALFIRCKLSRVQPWRWALLFFWFAIQIYMNVMATGSMSKLSFFDIVLYGIPSFNFGIVIWFPLSLLTVMPPLSFHRELSLPEQNWRSEKNWKKWILAYALYAVVISSLIIVMYLGTYLLVCTLFFGVGGFDFSNSFSFKMWEGYALIPKGSLIGNFVVYILCLLVYCIFYVTVILCINLYSKQEIGMLGPLLLHCVLFLWWEFQIHELYQNLAHQRVMCFMMQSWGGILIWAALTAGLLYLTYKSMPHRVADERSRPALYKPFASRFYRSGWFWTGTLCFVSIVLYSLWNTPISENYTAVFGTQQAGINLCFQAFTSISWLWTSYAYIFAMLCCVDVYQSAFGNTRPWRALLHTIGRGAMMVTCASFILVVLYTMMTGKLYVEEPIQAVLFAGHMTSSVLQGTLLVCLHQIIWISTAAAAGYAVCSAIQNWQYSFTALTFFLSCGSYIWNMIWQNTFLEGSAPVSPFSIGSQSMEIMLLLKQWLLSVCLILAVLAFGRYRQKKCTEKGD